MSNFSLSIRTFLLSLLLIGSVLSTGPTGLVSNGINVHFGSSIPIECGVVDKGI